MVTLLMLMVLGVLTAQVGVNSSRLSTRQRSLAQAFNLAEAGCDMAFAYLQSLGAPPSNSLVYPTSGGVVTFFTGTTAAVIAPDASNPGSWLKSYIITATGTANDGMTRTVTARVRQQSFSLYAYFTDQEISPITNGTIYFFWNDAVHGPAHTNDKLHIAWSRTDTTPIFYDTVSSVNTSVDYYTNGTPTNNTDWKRIFSGGQSALRTGVGRIELPDTSDGQCNAAWGASTGFPTTNGIYVPTANSAISAGIYIRGDCTVQFSVDAVTGNQIVTIVQGSTTKVITVDLDNNATIVKINSGNPTTYTGVPNGVIYTTGNITSLKGTLGDNYYSGSSIIRRNAWTVATDVDGGKDIVITDNLRYQTQPDSTKPATDLANLKAPMLGIVSEDVKLTSACPTNMTLNAVTLAGGRNTSAGTFWYEGYSGSLKGNLNLLGGLIQKKRGPVGQFNQSSGQATAGYAKNYNYDPRVVDSPPPFFPTTGMYDMMSWQFK